MGLREEMEVCMMASCYKCTTNARHWKKPLKYSRKFLDEALGKKNFDEVEIRVLKLDYEYRRK